MKKKILIAGASGHLGGKVYEKLVNSDKYQVHAFVRSDSRFDHMEIPDSNKHLGDLRDVESVKQAMDGMEVLITTANAAVPRKKEDTFHHVDYLGNKHLIDAAKESGIEQFIFVSVSNLDKEGLKHVPLGKSKIKAEDYLKKSGLPYTILRPTVFMDVSLTFMGTDIPVRGEKAHTVLRPWKFMNNFYNGVKDNVENGKIGIIGSGETKQNYIAVEDVSEYVARSVGREDMIGKTFDLAGPENLNSLEIKGILEEVLDKPLTIKRTPAFMMGLLGRIYSVFNKEIANIFFLNHANSKHSMVADSKDLATKLGINQTSVKDFLLSKLK